MFSPARWLNLVGQISTVRLVAIVAFFSQLYFFAPVMTPYLQAKGLSLAQIAGMQTVLMVSMLLMEIPTGVLADRLGHRRSFQISLFTAAAGELITLLADTYPEFLIGQIVAGTGAAFASGSLDALVYESLPTADRTRGMQRAKGAIGAAMHAGALVAFTVGGLLTRDLTFENMRFTLKLDVVFVGFAALLALMLREPVREVVAERLRSLDVLKVGFANLRGNVTLQRLVLIAIVTNPFEAHLLIFYQDYFLRTGVAPVWLGLALALGSAVGIFTQLHAWRLSARFGDRTGLFIATAAPGLLYLGMAVITTPTLAVIVFVVQWGVVQLAKPLLSGLYNQHFSEHARATGLSLVNGVVTIYIGVGGVVLGWLAGISLPVMFAILGAIILAGACLIRPLHTESETN